MSLKNQTTHVSSLCRNISHVATMLLMLVMVSKRGRGLLVFLSIAQHPVIASIEATHHIILSFDS